MGWQATGWAFNAKIENAGAKFVLVALAERAGNEDDDAEFWHCWPSIETICKYTSQGYRTVQRHLDWLEAEGFIQRKRRAGSSGKLGGYMFTLCRFPDTTGQNGQRPEPPAKNDEATGQNGQTEPVKEPSDRTGEGSRAREGDLFDTGSPEVIAFPSVSGTFGDWWALYPRKVSKGAAEAAYLKACKLLARERPTEDPATILRDGVISLALECEGKEQRFTPHAATWLNARGWEDEAGARRPDDDRQFTRTGSARSAERLNSYAKGLEDSARDFLRRHGGG